MVILRLIIFFIFITLISCDDGNVASSYNLPVNENQTEQDIVANKPTTTEQNIKPNKSVVTENTEIWKGQVGKFSVNWAKNDISFSPNSSPKVKYKLSSIFEKRFNDDFIEVKKTLPDSTDRLRNSTSLSIKSIVGTIVSIEMTHVYGIINTAHELTYISFDLKTLDKAKLKNLFVGYLDRSKNNLYLSASAKLSDYFTEDEIFSALINSLSKNSKKIKLDRNTFLSMINHNSVKMPKASVNVGANKDGTDLFLTEDSFRSFVFERIEDQKVIVRMQVYENTGKPYEIHWVEIKLPTSSRLKPQLERAKTFQNSFLSNSAEVKFKDAETILIFEKAVN